MSFGFSVGDFLAAANLIAEVVSALREAGGSGSQYQHITNKLEVLDRALRDVNRLEPAEGLEEALEAIKTTALSCQIPLLEYLSKIGKYNKSLGTGQSSGVMKDVFSKMEWQTSKKSEAAMRLEAEIVAYLGAINLLLGLYKIKVDSLVEQRARTEFGSLTATLAKMNGQTQTLSANVAEVGIQIEQSKLVVREDIKEASKQSAQALSTLKQVCLTGVAEFLKTTGALSGVTLQTYSKVSEIYNTIMWVRTRLSQPDTRHTWLQEPIRLEDAYGRVFPIPAEFDYAMMEGALRGHFRNGRGKQLVERNRWQLFDPSNPQTEISADNWEPIPGMKITMAMIVPQFDDHMVCPRLNCSSNSYTDALGGGKLWCGTWFDGIMQYSSAKKIMEIDDQSEEELIPTEFELIETAKSRLWGMNEEDFRLLKNARVRLEDPDTFWAKADKPLNITRGVDITMIEGNDKRTDVDKSKATVPTFIRWQDDGQKVYVMGSFSQWETKHRLDKIGMFCGTALNLRPGIHHLRFIVDGVMKCSSHLPATVDSGNNLVNYIEVKANDMSSFNFIASGSGA